jgi:hypothetical protein
MKYWYNMFVIYNNINHDFGFTSPMQTRIPLPAGYNNGTYTIEIYYCYNNQIRLHKDYTFPVFLDSRPLFLNFSLYNINDISGTNYCSFDVDISKLGNKKGELLVSSDYGSLCSFNLDESENSTFHVSNALKLGNLYLNITLENDYGTTARTIDLGKYPNLLTSKGINTQTSEVNSVNDNESGIEIFDMKGVKISNAKKLSDLKAGLYIIRNIKQPWNTKKITVK